MTTRLRLPRALDLLLVWHGLFAGSYIVAYVTSEGAHGLHRFAGYGLLALLTLRLLAAALAREKSVWALPWARLSMWRNFGARLWRDGSAALGGRTPFTPLSGLLLLAILVPLALSGLTADWWRWDDLHEGLAEASLALVLGHVAVVSAGPLLRRLRGAGVAADG